jgi:hypothetical protein
MAKWEIIVNFGIFTSLINLKQIKMKKVLLLYDTVMLRK